MKNKKTETNSHLEKIFLVDGTGFKHRKILQRSPSEDDNNIRFIS